ncbi:MAG: hypothetical protein IT427_16175 [Pirellulales bacterium]|nr:hypothetical protein [Pirellulales bacterium]
MSTSLIHTNVVAVARQFNPSVFSQLWLVRHGIASENEFEQVAESLFTPAIVQVRLPRFVLLVVPEQLQFAPLPPDVDHSELVLEKMGKIVETLPETPYIAIGLNFQWHFIPETCEMSKFCRRLFFRDNLLFSSFDQPDARFGGYMSKDVLGFRLRLDVRPLRVEQPEGVRELFQFAFNFHTDIASDVQGETSVSQIRRMLGQWNQAREHTRQIVSNLEA